jgi:hypothetical protein
MGLGIMRQQCFEQLTNEFNNCYQCQLFSVVTNAPVQDELCQRHLAARVDTFSSSQNVWTILLHDKNCVVIFTKIGYKLHICIYFLR